MTGNNEILETNSNNTYGHISNKCTYFSKKIPEMLTRIVIKTGLQGLFPNSVPCGI